MKMWLVGFTASVVALAVLDGIWLGLIAANFYKSQFGPLLRERPIWLIAALFYLVHAAGIATFALPQAQGWGTALLFGALFGFCTYAAYDLTNLATLRGWPSSVAAVDLAWGSVASAVVALAAWAAQRQVFP